jgi:hypothetical protein
MEWRRTREEQFTEKVYVSTSIDARRFAIWSKLSGIATAL